MISAEPRDCREGGEVRYRFGDHLLDPERRELLRGTELVEVEPQVFDLLLYLIRNRRRVVSKDDLITAVWGPHNQVANATIDSRVMTARQAVGDSGRTQSLIRTYPRKGIRFVGTVEEEEEHEPVPVDAAAAKDPQSSVPDAALRALPEKPPI